MLLRLWIDWHFFLNFRSILSDKESGMMRIGNTQRNQRLWAEIGIFSILGLVLCIFPFGNASAEDRTTRQSMEMCLAELTGNPLKEIRLADLKGKNVLPTLLLNFQSKKLSPEQLDHNIRDFCSRNGNAINSSTVASIGSKHNRFNSFETKPVLRLPGLDERKVSKDGVCEATYEVISLAQADLKKFGKGICEDRAKIEEENRNCITANNSERECVDKLEKSIIKLESINRDSQKALEKIAGFFKEAEKPITRVLKRYEEDRAHFAQQIAAPRRPVISTYPDGSPFQPAEFGALTLDEYLQWVGKNQTPILLQDKKPTQYRQIESADLVNEQILALAFLIAYDAKVRSVIGEQFNAKGTSDIAAYREQIAKIKARLPGDGDWDKWTQKTPQVVAAAAPFMQKAPGAASGLAGAGALAALGAGAALGSQVTAARSSSPLGETLPTQQSPNAVAPLANTKITETTESPQNAPGLPIQNSEPKAATTEKPESKETAANPIGSNPAVFSSGASFKQNGFKTRNVKPSTSANGDLGGSGKSDDALKPFGGELLAGPAPKKVDSSGDVSSLLGQMKDLFNFDDAGGMPGGSEGMPDLGQNNPFGGEEGGDLAAANEEFTGSDEGSEDEAGRQYASNEEEIIGSPTQARAYLGGIETPLFKRVKSRHKRCMEKGLVILGLGKLPQ
jgi:hypothetical protein